MRVIINDKRYSALKTLGEKKQAFNEVCLCFSSNGSSFFEAAEKDKWFTKVQV
jgi:hypothetical protein